MGPSENNNEYFNWYVKSKLKQFLDDIEKKLGFKPSIASINNILIERGCRSSVDTLRRMIDPKNPTNIDFYSLSNLCEILGVNLYDVLPPIKKFSGSPSLIWESVMMDNNIKSLPTPFYEGTYHCYYFAPMHMMELEKYGQSATKTQKIKHAELTLKRNNGITEAVLTETGGEPGFTPSSRIGNMILTGEAKLFIYMNQVQIELTSPEGLRYMNIMFPYIHLATDYLYSQVGALLSVSTEQSRFPVLQKIVLCRNPIDLDSDGDTIRGILSMNSNEIIVRKEEWDKLTTTNPLVKKFIYSEVTVDADGSPAYYVYHEDKLHIWYRENRENTAAVGTIEYSCFMKAIMELRNASISAAIYKIKEHDRFNVFSKNLQQGNIP